MFHRFLLAIALLLATLTAPAAFAGQHHLVADGFNPPIESISLT